MGLRPPLALAGNEPSCGGALADCREWVEIEDEPSCKAQLVDYQSYGDCQERSG